MGEPSDREEDDFTVVVNDEEQYSVWRAEQALPLGWRSEGTTGSRAECLAHIAEVWTDVRPRSLRAADGAASAGNYPRDRGLSC
jgi:MbtH protein